MSFLQSLTAATASALPAAASLSSSPSPSSSLPFPTRKSSLFSSLTHFIPLKSTLHMASPTSLQTAPIQENGGLPELVTEFMVDMKCGNCVSSVKDKLLTLNGVKSVEADLDNQVVRVLGNSPVKTVTDAVEQIGRKARLIGQGVPEEFLVSAAVAEFKGPVIFGVVRLAQVSMELARIDASLSGLSPGRHGWSINEYGDLTKGAASTGKIYNASAQPATDEPLGDLGTLDVNDSGEAQFTGSKEKLRVADLIGRALVVYKTDDKSVPGITAAVIARSAGVGENYKKICLCDGTTIWESTNADFVTS